MDRFKNIAMVLLLIFGFLPATTQLFAGSVTYARPTTPALGVGAHARGSSDRDSGSEESANTTYSWQSLRKAVENDDLANVRKHLQAGVDPNVAEHNRGPLWYACYTSLGCMPRENQLQIIQLLLENGADPSQKTAMGNTPWSCTEYAKDQEALDAYTCWSSAEYLRGKSREMYERYKVIVDRKQAIQALLKPYMPNFWQRNKAVFADIAFGTVVLVDVVGLVALAAWGLS